jgi:hypothetical protein
MAQLDWKAEYAYTTGMQAFIYGFPYMYNAQLRHDWVTNKRDPDVVPYAAVDHFWHAARLIDASYRDGDRTPGLRWDHDGGLTIRLQPESPGGDGTPNWLPTSAADPWFAILRMYRPHPEVIAATWNAPESPRRGDQKTGRPSQFIPSGPKAASRRTARTHDRRTR